MSVNDNAVLSAHEIVLFVGYGALVRAMRAPGYAVWVLYPGIRQKVATPMTSQA